MESGCGAATNLYYLKKYAKLTAGLDNIYQNHVMKNHKYFNSLSKLKESKEKFDIILSLAEIEHKFNVLNFVKILIGKLNKNGFLIFEPKF